MHCFRCEWPCSSPLTCRVLEKWKKRHLIKSKIWAPVALQANVLKLWGMCLNDLKHYNMQGQKCTCTPHTLSFDTNSQILVCFALLSAVVESRARFGASAPNDPYNNFEHNKLKDTPSICFSQGPRVQVSACFVRSAVYDSRDILIPLRLGVHSRRLV